MDTGSALPLGTPVVESTKLGRSSVSVFFEWDIQLHIALDIRRHFRRITSDRHRSTKPRHADRRQRGGRRILEVRLGFVPRGWIALTGSQEAGEDGDLLHRWRFGRSNCQHKYLSWGN